MVRAKLAQKLGQCSPIVPADFSFLRRNEKLFFFAIKKGRERSSCDRKGTIFSNKMDNFIAVDFTTQSEVAEVSGTAMVILVIVLSESSDKNEFYNHVRYHFVLRCKISDVLCT